MNPVRTASRGAVAAAVPVGMARRFDAEAAGDLDAVFELRLSDSGQRYAVHVAGGRCAVERRPAPEAGAQVSISSGDLVRLVSGAIPWTALLAHGRLELGGDPFLALRFPKLFGIGSR